MPMSTFLKNAIYTDYLASVDLVLYETAPTASTDGVEVVGYTRPTTSMVQDAGDPGLVTNDVEIPLTDMPECDVVAVGVVVVGTDDLLFFDSLSTPKHFDAGDDTVLNPGDIGLQIN